MKDYGTAFCKICTKKVERDYRKPKAVYCSRTCYYESMRGKPLDWNLRKAPVKRICNGILCRGNRKFLAYAGARICYRCKVAMREISGDDYPVSLSRIRG